VDKDMMQKIKEILIKKEKDDGNVENIRIIELVFKGEPDVIMNEKEAIIATEGTLSGTLDDVLAGSITISKDEDPELYNMLHDDIVEVIQHSKRIN
jgi:hypothetical protein